MSRKTYKQRAALFSWVLFITLICFFALKKELLFDSSIFTLLPQSDQQVVVRNAAEKMTARFSNRFILLFSGSDEKQVRHAVSVMADGLEQSEYVGKVIWQLPKAELIDFQEELFPYRFTVLDARVRKQLLAGEYERVRERAILRIFSPLSTGKIAVIDDPFGLAAERAFNSFSALKIGLSNGLLKVTAAKQPTYMLSTVLTASPFLPELQRGVLAIVDRHKAQFAAQGVTVSMSGMLMHAAAGAKQARSEISTIGAGSLLGIIIAALLVFRRFKPLLLMLIPVGVGCILATAVTILIFERVHLVTFAFGAGLVGVSVDYALHFLCERHISTAGVVLRRILPGLLLGLLSSVTAYAAQALAPFPGLQQMATFAVAGLIGSWLTVVICFPLFTRDDALQPLAAAELFSRVRRSFPRVDQSRVLAGFFLCLLLLASVFIWRSEGRDDIRLLQTSPVQLLEQERHVQDLLGLGSSSFFLLISAETLEQCLQEEERLAPLLERLREAELFDDFQALSRVLPSLQRQAENERLTGHLYQGELNALYDLLKLPESRASEAGDRFTQEHGNTLTPQRWLELNGSEGWRHLIVSRSAGSAATVIHFSGAYNDQLKVKLAELAETEKAIYLVDQVANISHLMSSYRLQIINLVVAAYLSVFLLLFVRYGREVWRVVLPPLIASILTLALLVGLGQGVNIFHLMALILVLGIGLDMGIFLIETDESPYTWLAVSLSICTSLLAFGLLALSRTPVLHHFGLTVLVGLSLVWLIAPTMRKA